MPPAGKAEGGDVTTTIVPPKDRCYTLGKTIDGTKIFDSCRPEYDKDEKIIIGIKGNWYDVTTYVPHHPGGDVLKEFAGRDCTCYFAAYHKFDILEKRKPCGTYKWDLDAADADPMDAIYLKLNEKFTKLGFFDTVQTWWLASKIILLSSALAYLLGATYYYNSTSDDTTSWSAQFAFYSGALSMGLFWHQCSAFMHDTMHNHYFHNRHIDQWIGWLTANCGAGISSRWWRDEHNEHHTFTNTVVSGVAPSDPQMTEGVWIHNKMQVQFFPKLKHFLLPIQHIIYLPALFLVGWFGIRIDSALSERRPREFLGIAIYYTWLFTLLSTFANWKDAFLFHYLASATLGSLEMQLTLSHYSRPFHEKLDCRSGKVGWMRRQIAVAIDIDNPWWTDWFHSGLNIHTVHHLWPRMCRSFYRQAYKVMVDELKEQKKKHPEGDKILMPDMVPWWPAVWRNICALKDVSKYKHFDPRA